MFDCAQQRRAVCDPGETRVAGRGAFLKAGLRPPPPAATALTPSAHRSLGFACARPTTERGVCALDQLNAYRLASHFWCRSIMTLRMQISLRMQAISATFFGLPLATRRS